MRKLSKPICADTDTDQIEPDALSTDEAARFLGAGAQTLANWRAKRIGPPYFKMYGIIRYSRHDLEAWRDSCRVMPPPGRVKPSKPEATRELTHV